MTTKQEEDPFASVYSLNKSGRATEVLKRLYDERSWRLRSPFSHDPNHAWYCVGTILYDRADYRQAIRALRNALRSRPDDVAVLWALGNCHAELHRPKLAERYFEKALALPNRDKQQLLYNLANALFDQGKYEDALSRYRVVARSKVKDLAKRAERNAVLAKERISSAR